MTGDHLRDGRLASFVESSELYAARLAELSHARGKGSFLLLKPCRALPIKLMQAGIL